MLLEEVSKNLIGRKLDWDIGREQTSHVPKVAINMRKTCASIF
jgi:hypothetical protein